jgi:hypothetical protein
MSNALVALSRVLQRWMSMGLFDDKHEDIMERWMEIFL